MGRKLATAIAALGALGTGYMQGKKMTEDQEWEKEKRQREREAMARQDAERQAASDTIAKVGTQTVDPEQAGRAVGVDPSLIAKDIADFGPEGAKATVNPATIAAAGIQPDAVKTTPYSREQATGDYVKRMYAINPDKAAQVEGQQMQLDVARDGAETRGKLKRVDGKLRAWGEKTFKNDDSGNPAIDDQGMVHMGKMRSFLLSQEGLYDEAMKTADNSMKYAVAKIQADQVERQAAVRDAVAAAAQGDFTKAMETYKRFVPDGANATNVVQQKDGTIVIERESAVDGAKLPNQTFKSLDQFVSSLNALSDSKALTEYIDRTFRRDIDSRRLNLEGSRVDIAKDAESRAKGKDARDQKRQDAADQAIADMDVAERAGDKAAYNNARLRAIRNGVKLEKPKDPIEFKTSQYGGTAVEKLPDGSLAVTPTTAGSVGKTVIVRPRSTQVADIAKTATPGDIKATAEKYGITEEEVKRRMGIK